MKQFKTESKKLMDLMINSIYTNKEIFLREIISNSSDAIDKLYYISLTDKTININKKDFKIKVSIDKEKRLITISDNGIGMSKDELETNLGTIAKSDSYDFKNLNEHKKNIDIIGQFGVGFYSAFMVSKKISVISLKYNEKDAYMWESKGVEGYNIVKTSKDSFGTEVILELKDDTSDENYSKYLDIYELERLIKKYSNYITYPIIINKDNKDTVINDMVPIWNKRKNTVKEEDYNNFYKDKFSDYKDPLRVINIDAEGQVNYKALLFIPEVCPYNFYSKEYEKGLKLYSNGVLIMDKCKELIPDYYSFVKGVVDSIDLKLNISREILQQDKVLSIIGKNIENKIHKELLDMKDNERDKYIKFYNEFSMQLKYGIYNNFGMNKEKLVDLLLFTSSKDKKLISLDEYINNNKDQKEIYYVCGETIEKIDNLPITEEFKDKNIEVLYCTNYMDEFVMKIINTYKDKEIKNITSDNVSLSSEEEKEALDKLNNDSKEMFDFMKESISDVTSVRYTNKLKKHPVCLTSLGDISLEMEKVINKMPNNEHISSNKVLEINKDHKIVSKLKDLYKNDKEEFKKYSKILYSQARLIEGLEIDNPIEITNLIFDCLSK